jgi:Methyltransferase domain
MGRGGLLRPGSPAESDRALLRRRLSGRLPAGCSSGWTDDVREQRRAQVFVIGFPPDMFGGLDPARVARSFPPPAALRGAIRKLQDSKARAWTAIACATSSWAKQVYGEPDRSAKMIEAAARRNAAHVEAGKAEFLVANLEHLDLGERRFDGIFAVRVGLFHREPDRAHASWSGGLRPAAASARSSIRPRSVSNSPRPCEPPDLERGAPLRARVRVSPNVPPTICCRRWRLAAAVGRVSGASGAT